MTCEQASLQDGLVHAGWHIAGSKFDLYWGHHLDCQREQVHVTSRADLLLLQLKPEAIFIQDPRDMMAESPGCFDKWTNFECIESLASYPGFKVLSFKDAAVAIDYQRDFAAKINADALATYYHQDSIRLTSPWADNYQQIRHYHCVDADIVRRLDLRQNRMRGLVSGHTSTAFYPLRHEVARHAHELGLTVLPHPGWNNHGCKVPEYLALLACFKVHVATATRYGHALRKIIESVCCGCQCVTNLPVHDKLPVIDDWLIRLPVDAKIRDVKVAVDKAEAEWDMTTALQRARAACEYYDFRADARRLDMRITQEMEARATIA